MRADGQSQDRRFPNLDQCAASRAVGRPRSTSLAFGTLAASACGAYLAVSQQRVEERSLECGTINLNEIMLRVVGAFYAFAGYAATRAMKTRRTKERSALCSDALLGLVRGSLLLHRRGFLRGQIDLGGAGQLGGFLELR